MKKTQRLGAALIVAGLALLGLTAPAFATADKVWVCHNVVHNPVLIHVDDDSTKLQGHLGHADTLGDVIEGVDGKTEADVRAACTTEVEVPGPTVTVTGPAVTVTVPGPTDTVTLPGDTVTVTGPDVTITEPGNTSTVTLPDEVVTVPGETTTVTGPDKVVTVDSTVTSTAPGVTRTVVRDGKDTLAYTGMDVGLVSLGVACLGAGVLLLVLRRRTAH